VVYIMDKWVGNLLSERERLMGQLVLLTSAFFIGTAIVLRMDMLMCMFIVLALYTFFKMYSGEGKPRDPWLFPIFVFMALFTKGPMGIIVPLVSTVVFLVLKKEIKTIGRYWGWKTLAIIFTLCVPWLAGVYYEGGDEYLNNLLFNQTFNRAVNSFHHKEPFYYYFLTILYSLVPWSLLVMGIFLVGLKKRMASTDLERFFLVIALSTFGILSVFSSKLAVYLLPALPFFVYLSILWLPRLGSPRWIIFLISIPAGILCLALPGVVGASQIIELNGLGISPLAILAGLILSGTGILSVRFLIKSHLKDAIITICSGLLLAIFAFSFAIPKYNSFIGLRDLSEQAKETSSQLGGANYYYCVMTKGDNLDIYLGIKPEKLKICDLYKAESPIKTPAIIFTWNKFIDRNDSLRGFFTGKKIHRSGGYCYIEIEK